MKTQIGGVLVALIMISISPEGSASEGCEHEVEALCELQEQNPFEYACFGAFGAPESPSSIGKFTGIEPYEEYADMATWAGILIATGGSGEPYGHTSFAFVGGITNGDSCENELIRADYMDAIASYWSSSVAKTISDIICGGCPP